MEDLRKQANDLLVFYGKMQNRLSQAGVNDTGSLVSMFKQLERGLDAVALEELEPALQEVTRLVDSLNRMHGDLQVLREIKLRVEKTKAVLNGAGGRSDELSGAERPPRSLSGGLRLPCAGRLITSASLTFRYDVRHLELAGRHVGLTHRRGDALKAAARWWVTVFSANALASRLRYSASK